MKLINPLPPDASYLYHYTSTDTALDHILKDGTLKFNSFSEVNDPKERKEWDISPLVRLNTNLSLEQYDAISREVSDILKANAKLVCFSRDKDETKGSRQLDARFGRGFVKPSMWHHYAGKHDGLCLMFDSNKLQNAFAKQLDTTRLVSGEVIYSNQGSLPRLQGDTFIIDLTSVTNTVDYISAIQSHLNRFFAELFLRKLSDWAHEDEFRWIYFDVNPDPLYLEFGDSLEAIVVGEQVKESKSEEILRYCVKYRAEIANLNWHNGFPKIERSGQPYVTHKHLLD